MIDQLLPVFYNNTRSLEVLYLLKDLKKIVRLDASEHELAKIRKFCAENDLFLSVSEFKVVKITDEGKGSYSNRVEKLPKNDPSPGLFHIYISKEESLCDFLKLLEEKGDDRGIGEALGYPSCCVEFFIQNKDSQGKIQNDFILPAIENSSSFMLPYFSNHIARYFDITLLSHFPHSFECKESCKIAQERLDCIAEYSEKLAETFVAILKSPVLYTERDGVFIFRNHSFDSESNILTYEKALTTADTELFQRLQKLKKIEVIDKNTVTIGDRVLENIGFMIFI